MRVVKFLIFTLFISLALIPSESLSHGVHLPPIPDHYNNQMISDAEFRASGTMTEAQIQAFLVARGSALANYRIPTDGSVPTTIGPNFATESGGWTAARVIHQSAQWYNINPQVLLVTLQKEQSLITSGNLNLINSAMGYDCPEGPPREEWGGAACNPRWFGFARQVFGAAFQLDFNFIHSEANNAAQAREFRRGNTAIIDGRPTFIANSATASLYRYTPHRPDSAWIPSLPMFNDRGVMFYFGGNHYYGNYNFIRFYNSWFNYALHIRDSVFVHQNISLGKNSFRSGESISPKAVLQNYSRSRVSIETIVLANVNNNTGQSRSFTYVRGIVLEPLGTVGDILEISTSTIVAEPGLYTTWLMFHHNNVWHDFNASRVNYTATTPNIMATWFDVPLSGISGQAFTPGFRIKNFENVDIRLNSVGIANWLNWPNPNMRDFGFAENITIPAGQEINIPMPERIISEPGLYKTWAIFRIGDSWHPITHVTGWPASYQGIVVRLPNIQASFLDVPSVITSGATVTPNFRVKNFESVPINLTFGVANWLNWPNPNMRDFGFSPVSIPANSEAHVNVGTRALTERGVYRTFALMRVRDSFYQMMHTTGWPSVFRVEVR